jgi:ABC-type multidrug transport system ATPase subunit
MDLERNDGASDEHAEKFSFSWENVDYSVKEKNGMKQILHNLSGEVHSGQTVAILGGTGAGKTTLLNVLAGRIGSGSISGEILFKNAPRQLETWKKDCAYVEQEDVLHTNLTVEETLSYAAYFRLPTTMTEDAKKQRVEDVIMDLGLNGCRNTVIGNSWVRGISGGEKKRVSIGQELVTIPQILFLDEPTSGLDSFTAFNIVETVKKIAVKQNKIVVMTVHQPRTDIIEMFDKILILSAGRTMWFGSTQNALKHFSDLGYPIPPNTNPSDFFLDIVTLDQRNEELKSKSTERIEFFARKWSERNEAKSVRVLDGGGPPLEVLSRESLWFRDFVTLFGRDLKLVVRDKYHLIAVLAQTAVMVVVLGGLFWNSGSGASGIQNKVGVLFFLCINLTFTIIMPIVALLPLERTITRRERSAGAYSVVSAFLSRWLTSIPLSLLLALALSIPIYYMVGFENNSAKFLKYLLALTVHGLNLMLWECWWVLRYLLSQLAKSQHPWL